MALPVGQTVEHHRRIKAACDAYLRQLQEYLAVLPAQSLQGLGDSAPDLYNLFNRENPFSAQILALRLPRAENGRIELKFVGQPGEVFDALLILSEGNTHSDVSTGLHRDIRVVNLFFEL